MMKYYKNCTMELHRYIFYVIIATLVPTITFAKQLKVNSFEVLSGDRTAQTSRVNDMNGNMCALIKVALPIKDCTFEGYVISQSFNGDEYMVYMANGGKQLQLRCPGFETLYVNLTTTEGITGVKSGVTYSLKLSGYEDDINYRIQLYYKDAEQGDATAQFLLGFCYRQEEKHKEAIKWFRKAAEQGHPGGQVLLGSYFYYGDEGVTQNYTEAAKLFHKAAEQGDEVAQSYLGRCYETGRGVKKDYKEAVKWYRKAAEQGDATAQYSLGECYETGKGVTKDYKEAVKWYYKAAEQGDEDAIKKVKELKHYLKK